MTGRERWYRYGWHTLYCWFLAVLPALLVLILAWWGVLAPWFEGFGFLKGVVTISALVFSAVWMFVTGMHALHETSRLRECSPGGLPMPMVLIAGAALAGVCGALWQILSR